MEAQQLAQYFSLSPEQIAKFAQLPELYAHWNAQINVISRQDVDNLIEKHVLHSLAIAKVQDFKPGAAVLNVGTGGGFPGIPLAILFPKTEFLLTDSIGKKIKVVTEVAAALGLDNVTAQHIRSEQVRQEFDFVVSRAVAPLGQLLDWTQGRIVRNNFHELKNGLLCLKGGDLSDEIKQSGAKSVRKWEISTFFPHPFFETKQVLYVPYR